MIQKKVFVKPVAVAKKFEGDDVLGVVFMTYSADKTAGTGNAGAKQR